MTNDDLNRLPRIEASADFEARLFEDALASISNSETAMDKRAPVSLWTAFALAASLALGVSIGISQSDALNFSSGVLTVAEDTAELDFNVYSDALLAFND